MFLVLIQFTFSHEVYISAAYLVHLQYASALNPFPHKAWFLRVCRARLLKTLWEKEKLLITSNFSFSPSVFYTDFADVNFKLNGNGRKFSKQVENTVGNGEIARYEQFLLCPWCFQKTCIADT